MVSYDGETVLPVDPRSVSYRTSGRVASLRQLIKGSTPYVVWQHRRLSASLRRWKPEDQLRYDFYRQLICQNGLVFDIGADLGNRTKTFLRLGAKVIAFEPQPLCADLLTSVLSDNPSFLLVRKGLGDKPDLADMLTSQGHYEAGLKNS